MENQQFEQAETIRILLIEDNEADARLVEIYLAESTMLDCRIQKAVTLKEGLSILEEHEFDVILLDLTLPDSKGYNTVETMIKEFPEYTIIVMTGSDDESVAIRSVKIGAQDFIVKGSFDANLLSRTIRYAIERHGLTRSLEQSTKKIKENEARLKEAQKMARIGTWELDIVTNKMYWSEEVYNILGLDPARLEEPTLKDYMKYVASSEQDRLRDSINRTMEKGEPFDIEYRLEFKDHLIKYVANQGRIQMSQKRKSISLIGTIQDISSFRMKPVTMNGETDIDRLIELVNASSSMTGELIESGLSGELKNKAEKLKQLIDQMGSTLVH